MRVAYSFRQYLALLYTVLAIVIVPAIAYSAEKVTIRAGEHATFARLVLDWGHAQKYEAAIAGGFLTIDFKKPFEADLKIATDALDAYLAPGEFIKGKTGIRFPLKGNYRLKTATFGTAIAFDLIKQADPADVSNIKVRKGDHADFSRLVVDWPARTGFSIDQTDQTVTLHFDKPGKLLLNPIKRDLPAFLKSVDTTTADGKTTLTVHLQKPATVKAFRSGSSIAFDFRERPIVVTEAPAKQKVSKTVNPVRKISKNEDSKVRPESKPENLNPQVDKTVAAKSQPHRPLVQETVPTRPRSLIPADETVHAIIAPKDIAPPSKNLIVETGKLKDGFRLIFPWDESAGMAFFERAGTYWMVFDKRAKLDFKNLGGPYKFLVVRKKQIPHETATVARLVIREGYAPSVTRNGNEWQIDFRLGEAPIIENSIDIQPQPASTEGARVFIPAVNNGDKITFVDPQAGDELIAVPLYSPSWGMGTMRTFAQFAILPSTQGIALTPKGSEVQVAVERNGVSITAEGGLQLSRTISKEDLFAGGDQTDRFARKTDKAFLVKIEQWAQVPHKDFLEKKQYLQRKVARSPKAGRNASRMELAKFFVAHKFYADAFGVLERIRLDDPRADEDTVYRLLRGLSNLGLRHIEDAEKDLFHPAFSGVAEVAPWRAKLAAEKGDWKVASSEIKLGQDAFGIYNEDLQNEFKLLQARAALEDYDIEQAERALQSIKMSLEGGQDKPVAAEREYLEGVAALRSGDIERALGKFDQSIALDYRPIEVQARFAKINAELAQKDITPEEAIEHFRRMKFSWRGDSLELEILKRIGDLQIATGHMRDGLATFRSIVTTFPKSPLARDIAREMNDIFNQLFLEGGAEKIPPIKALALYYEYRELTPLGKKGDKMIRQLADRLIKVDLLDQAAQLLDHQVNFRLKGELKAHTGTKLAVVHLWNDNPQESLNILQKTRWRALSPAVKQERLHIEARAYSDLGDYDEALSLLEEEKSKKGTLLRADIYWKAKKWYRVIDVLQKFLKDSGAAKAEKLDPLDRQRLMQIAVARSLSNDQTGLAAMRKTYRKKMIDTPDLDAFDLITETPESSETEFRKRSTAIAKISQLESFMAGYREQLKNGEFWATN